MDPAQYDLNQSQWAPWTPPEIYRHLRAVDSVWYVVGGWALDLWHGETTRAHEDLEFCILRPDFPKFSAALADFDLFAASSGVVTKLENPAVPPKEGEQFWGLDRRNFTWAFDLMIEPGDETTWAYKRDPELTAPRSEMVHISNAGIPYLTPACVLLFKAKHQRPKDEIDFARALPKLSLHDRQWLQKSDRKSVV